jgi:hypothetical protein
MPIYHKIICTGGTQTEPPANQHSAEAVFKRREERNEWGVQND